MIGDKQFELTNHLGNVLVTVSDRKVAHDGNSDGTTDYYTADITSSQDYYPFGMLMPERTFSTSKYRFGFNGKENDDEINGWQDYGERMYNRLICRFPTIDPITKKYPELTPYQFASNSPIQGLDRDGLEILDFRSAYTWKVGKSIDNTKTVYIEIRDEFNSVHQEIDPKAPLFQSAPNTNPQTKVSPQKLNVVSDDVPKDYQTTSGNNISAAASAFLFISQSLYEFTNVMNKNEANDILISQKASELAYGVVKMNEKDIDKYFSSIKWSPEFKTGLDKKEFELSSTNFKADVMNYIIDKRCGRDDFINFPLTAGYPNDFSLYKNYVVRTGEIMLNGLGLNKKISSSNTFQNNLWETYKSVFGGGGEGKQEGKQE